MADVNNTNPTLVDLISDIIKTELETRLLFIPAEVKSYNAAKQVCDAEALVKISIEGTLSTLPIFRSVPVQWFGGAAGGLTVPLSSGDIVLLSGSSADLQQWLVSGVKKSDEASKKNHIQHSFIATPGLTAQSAPLGSTRYSSAGPVLFAQSTLLLGDSGATDKVVLENLLKAAITEWINTTFNTHVHASHGAPPTVLSGPFTGTIGATKVKGI